MASTMASSTGVEESSEEDQPFVYMFYALCVDKYIEARNGDLLPDEGTSQALGMADCEDTSSMGYNLYNAMKTLQLRGRFSRTMLEKALAYSETGYKEHIPLWIRSLIASDRSQYSHDLVQNQFRDVIWDEPLYRNSHRQLMDEGKYDPTLHPPPVPLAENRHTAQMAAIAKYAAHFFELLNQMALFDSYMAGDVHAPLISKEDYHYHCPKDNHGSLVDTFETMGPVWGIVGSELAWGTGVRSDGVTELSSLSQSERMLRAWNVLYYNERLCKTELEDAMVRGPSAMKELFAWAVYVSLHFKCNPAYKGLLEEAQRILPHVTFAEFPSAVVAQTSPSWVCDYCGTDLPRALRCASCQVAMYCNRNCQKKDFKRHKYLCTRHQQQDVAATNAAAAESEASSPL